MKTIPLDQLGETFSGFNVLCSDCGIRLGNHTSRNTAPPFTKRCYPTYRNKKVIFLNGWCVVVLARGIKDLLSLYSL